jgi:hypothetical protein
VESKALEERGSTVRADAMRWPSDALNVDAVIDEARDRRPHVDASAAREHRDDPVVGAAQRPRRSSRPPVTVSPPDQLRNERRRVDDSDERNERGVWEQRER